VRASELTNGRELRVLRDGDVLNRGTPQVWGLSVPIPRPMGREFLCQKLANFPEVPGVGGLEYMPDIDGDDGATRAPYASCLLLYTMET